METKVKDVKKAVAEAKKIGAEIEKLRVKQFELEEKNEPTDELEEEIFNLETEKELLEEEIDCGDKAILKKDEVKDLNDVKKVVKMAKTSSARLESLYATRYKLEKKNRKSESIENKIFIYETRMMIFEEIIEKASIIKDCDKK